MKEGWQHYQHRSDAFLKKGVAELGSGDKEQVAASYLALAAENLFRAAEDAPGLKKNELIEQAEEIIALAEKQTLTTGSDQPESPSGDDKALEPCWQIIEDTGVRLSDVAGLEEAKRQVYNMIIRPLSDPEGARRWGKRVGGGILLYGPPGTGKTHFARGIAGEVDAVFMNVVGSSLISKWFGEAEKNVNALFEEATSHERAVLFIDETEALLPTRDGNSNVMNRVVPAFLQAMDGIMGTRDGLFLLGATNRPDTIDPAALRPNRFDRHIYVGLPEEAARLKILNYALKDKPTDDALNLPSIAKKLKGYSGADITALCQEAASHAWDREESAEGKVKLREMDFENARARVGPSVSEDDLDKYVGFKDRFNSQ